MAPCIGPSFIIVLLEIKYRSHLRIHTMEISTGILYKLTDHYGSGASIFPEKVLYGLRELVGATR